MEKNQSPNTELSEREIIIYINLQASKSPPVFDLSLNQTLDVFFQIKRGIVGDEGPLPFTFSTTGSTFEGACGISSGAIQLTDRDDNTVIDLQNIDTNNWSSKAIRSISPSPNESFLTIAPRDRLIPPVKVLRPKFDHEIPLGLPINIREYLKSGHKYRLELVSRDFNIQWWAWGSASELGITSDTTLENLPSCAAGKIVASGHTHMDFTVVNSFPTPPTVIVNLLPPPLTPPRASHSDATVTGAAAAADNNNKKGRESEEAEAEAADQAPITQPRVLVTVKNTSSQTITVKSNMRQLFIATYDDRHPPWQMKGCARITSTRRAPSIENFSITDSSSGEELIPVYPEASGPPSGHAHAHCFTTLEPGVAVSNVVEFPTRLARLMGGRRCVLGLRTFGVAWTEGRVEELFRGAKERGERGGLWLVFMNGIRTPVMLECEDRLFYELPALEAED